MHPVSGGLYAEHTGIAETCCAPVFSWIFRPTFLAVDQQRRARDARPQLRDFLACHVVGWPDTHVVVELPTIGAVLVLAHAVLREVARLFGRQMWVLFLHATERILDRGITPREATG